jgi:hypothetical protein
MALALHKRNKYCTVHESNKARNKILLYRGSSLFSSIWEIEILNMLAGISTYSSSLFSIHPTSQITCIHNEYK